MLLRMLGTALWAALVCAILIVLLGRAVDQRIDELDRNAATVAPLIATLNNRTVILTDRVAQLELHDCGLRQEEDLSVSPQTDDATRERCARLIPWTAAP